MTGICSGYRKNPSGLSKFRVPKLAQSAAILLAAGESRRMGQLKALLPWKSSTLLEQQVKALIDAGISRVVVVLGHRHQELQPLLEDKDGVTWVVNEDYLQGKTTSIKAGLKALEDADIGTLVLLNVDQPRSSSIVRHLLERHRQSDYLITHPAHQGKGGHPIIFDASLLPELREIEEATEGIRTVVIKHAASIDRAEVDDPQVLWDLNTPEQYQRAINSQAPA